jgi:predicted dehydrogenase
MSSPVRVGFVGTGGIAGHHLKQLQEVEGVEIAALCDVVAERAQGRAQEFGGRPYADYRQMLERESLDALYLCVPPFAHDNVEVTAASAGIHLFVEKPVALDLQKGFEIRDAIRRAGVLSSVGYSLRYLPATEAARRYLRGRDVAMVTANRWGGLPATPWWRVMEQSGGQLVEMTTHQVDLMRFLVGEIVEVHARYARRALTDVAGVSVPDVQIATFLFENGAIGSITTSCALTQGGGRSDVDFLLRDTLLHYTTRDLRVSPDSAAPPAAVTEPIPNIDAAFIQAIRTGDPSPIRSTYDDGLRTLAVTLAANESARTGRPVRTQLGDNP